MPSADQHIEGIGVHGEDRESHGCARHAPAGGIFRCRQDASATPL